MDDQNTPSESIVATPVPASESVPAPTRVSIESSQPAISEPPDMPPVALESPTDAPAPIPAEDQNSGINQPDEAATPETIEPTPVEPVQSTPVPPMPSAPMQPDQTGIIRSLLVKAQAKIQFNKQKKLDKIIQLAEKKRIVANEDIQKLLHVSSATATRYLVKLVEQGRLVRSGNPRDAKYQFVG